MLPCRRFSSTLPVQSIGQNILYRAIALEALYGFHHQPPYVTVHPLFNLGAPKNGGRFTPRGGPLSLYLAEEPETAFAEVEQLYAKLRRQNPPQFAPVKPTVLISMNVLLDHVLDLTHPSVQSALQTNLQELAGIGVLHKIKEYLLQRRNLVVRRSTSAGYKRCAMRQRKTPDISVT